MRNILLFILGVLAIGCTDSTTDVISEEFNARDLDIVTGITVGNIVYGNPNTYSYRYTTEVEEYISEEIAKVNDDESFVAGSGIVKQWAVAATAVDEFQEVDFTSLYEKMPYAIETIKRQSVKALNEKKEFDLETLEPGFYRVFVLRGNGVLESFVHVSSDDYDEDPNTSLSKILSQLNWQRKLEN